MPLFKLQLCYMVGPLHPIQPLIHKNLKAAAPVLFACSFKLSLFISIWANQSGPTETCHWEWMGQTHFSTDLGTIKYASRTQEWKAVMGLIISSWGCFVCPQSSCSQNKLHDHEKQAAQGITFFFFTYGETWAGVGDALSHWRSELSFEIAKTTIEIGRRGNS